MNIDLFAQRVTRSAIEREWRIRYPKMLFEEGLTESKDAAMSDLDKEFGEREEPIQTAEAAYSAAAGRPSPAVIGRTIIIGILLAVVGAWLSSTLSDRFRIVENVESGESVTTGARFRVTRLVIKNAAQNAAVAYGLLGALLSLSLAITAASSVQGFSSPRLLAAGLTGLALGALFGGACSYAVTPIYFNRLETADITLSLLVHLAIWCAIGAAAGLAFGIGCGIRNAIAGSLTGGIVGGALATLLFDIGGAFLPLAHTERPLAELAETRLAAAAIVSVFVVLGTVIVAFQQPRAKSTNA